jgi:RecA-family ATPase
MQLVQKVKRFRIGGFIPPLCGKAPYMSIDDDKPKKFQYALPYKTFDECARSAPKNWLIENVIALGEDSSWYGPPGAGKSGLLMDLAVHVASGRDWRGYKFNRHQNVRPDEVNFEERRGVVYFALERADLTERRLRAYMQRDGLSGLPSSSPMQSIYSTRGAWR